VVRPSFQVFGTWFFFPLPDLKKMEGNDPLDPLAMSSLIVKAYLHDGFGAQIYSGYYQRLLILAAVMYVDGIDLVHWSRLPFCSPVELIAATQTAT
jgi:hypothetical protein